MGAFAALSLVLGLFLVAAAVTVVAVGDAYWGGWIAGYFGAPVLLVLGPVALLVGGIRGARRATRPARPPGPSDWERFLYYFGLKRDPRHIPR